MNNSTSGRSLHKIDKEVAAALSSGNVTSGAGSPTEMMFPSVTRLASRI